MAKEKAGEAYVELGVVDKMDAGLKAAADKFRKVGKQFAAVGAGISGIGAAALTPLVAMTNSFAEGAAEMNKLSTQTKISVEELSKLKFASSQVGVDFEDAAGAIEEFNIRMGETLQDGVGPAADALKRLGIDAAQLDMMPIGEQIGMVGEALSQLPRSQRQFLADEIFGGDAFKILPLLEQGREGIAALGRQAEEFGAVMSGDAAAGGAEYMKMMDQLGKVTAGIKNAIGSALVPVMTSLTEAFVGVVKPIREFVANNKEMFVTVAGIAAALVAGGAALTTFGFALMGIGSALATIGSAIAFVVSPLGIAIAAFAALGTAVYKYTEFGGKAVDWFLEKIEPIATVISDTFARVQEALVTGDLNGAFDAIIDGLEFSWLSLVDSLVGTWDGFVDWFFNISKGMVKAIGGLFDKLGEIIRSALEAYGSYYDKVFNFVTETVGELNGVRTIGGSVDAFQGGAAIGIDVDAIGDSVSGFGQALKDSAEGIGSSTKADRAARDAERRARLDALKKDISAGGAAARAAKEKRKMDRPDLPDLDKFRGQFAGGMAGAGEAAEQAKSAARGTFSSFGAMFLGGQDSIQKDQLKVQQKIADNTETMAGGSLASVFVA